MAAVKTGIILIWAGTNAAIPAGWTRETSLDAKYPKAWGTENPNVSGGSNTHSHTATTHGHTMSSHSHNITTNATSSPTGASGSGPAADNFGHPVTAIAGVSGGGLKSEVKTWASSNHEPPYYTVIFIKPASTPQLVPDDVIIHWNSASAPDGFTHCDGTGTTPDLRNKYLKGAAASGDGGSTGGATTHAHTISHSHTATGHTHSGTTAAYASGSRGGSGGSAASTYAHTHSVTLNSTTAGAGTYTNTTAGNTDTVEPAYKKVGTVQNTSGTVKPPPLGTIGLWLGGVDTVDLPGGWELCNGDNDTPDLRDKFIKVINTTGEIGDTGGSNTHTHTAVSHTHTATGTHTHSGSTGAGPHNHNLGGGDGYSPAGHTHVISNVTTATASWANTNIDSGSAVDNQPAYLTAAYLQYVGGATGAGVLAMMAATH